MVCALGLGFGMRQAQAQAAPSSPSADAAPVMSSPSDPPDGRAMIELNFPENLELQVLADYVGKRLGINFIYDEQIRSKQITIRAPRQIPADSLMTLLESALKIKGLAITPTEVPGMKRIEVAKQLTAISVGPADARAAAPRPTLAVTRVFELQHIEAERISRVIEPFLSTATANLTAFAEANLLIVTDYAQNMRRIEGLIGRLDRPGREVVIRFLPVRHQQAEQLEPKLRKLLEGRSKAAGTAAADAKDITLIADQRTNQMVFVGPTTDAQQVEQLVASLDVPLDLETKIYALAVASPEQMDRLIKKVIGELAAERFYQSATDVDASLLVVTTTPAIHQQIESLRQSLDRPVAESQSPIRFYKLENAKAADVLTTLQSIEADTGLADVSVDGISADEPAENGLAIEGPTESQVNRLIGGDQSDAQTAGVRLGGRSVNLPDARIMADEPTNTIIVVARPSMHAVYQKLIKRLDVRRPQVLVEATVVSVDTSDGFQLGVEIHSSEEADGGQLLNFTQFGLTTRDANTGQFTLNPGLGFTGALLNADVAEVVIRALETDTRAKVISRPSVLINDNATGVLTSQSEEPFASVNASSTVATTSFAGFAKAGTKVTVTPQISEGDHLKLEYEIELSSFGDDATDTLPPSRLTNSLSSEATIPDGHTIVLGGLTRENFMESVDRVPVLGSIPVVEHLFSSRSKDTSQATLFVFIRAVILRDDKFEYLKYLSGQAIQRAELAGDYPTSEPIEMP
jgi:general secretion pathway protein D